MIAEPDTLFPRPVKVVQQREDAPGDARPRPETDLDLELRTLSRLLTPLPRRGRMF